MIFPGNFLSGVVYFPVISLPAVYISLLFSLTTAAAVSSSYIMTKWLFDRDLSILKFVHKVLLPNDNKKIKGQEKKRKEKNIMRR